MVEKTNSQVWLAAALISVVVIACFLVAGGNKVSTDDVKNIVVAEMAKLNVPTAQEIADLVVIPEIEFPEYDFSGDYVLTKADYEKILQEDKAEILVLEEIDSRDFKKALFAALVDYNESIESYKHITEIVVKDIEIVIDDEEATITVDLKVYYYVDGDEDEDFKARFKEITFDVTKLVVEDNFEDAEVDFGNLVINKVY